MLNVGRTYHHPASRILLERGPTMLKADYPDPDHPASKPVIERGPTMMEGSAKDDLTGAEAEQVL